MGLNNLKLKIKKNKFLDSTSRIICYPILKSEWNRSNREMNKRHKGYIDQKYLWIKNLKESHKGESCFIVATGPSLTIEDLNLLHEKHIFCFGMNSILKLFDQTSWRPNIYGIQDIYVYDKMKADINNYVNGSNNDCLMIKANYIENDKLKSFYLNLLDHKMFHKKTYGKFQFSDDCYAGIYDSFSITFSLMQLAVYMGFTNIYLLGCDCNYNLPKTHIVDYGHKDPKAPIMGDKMIEGHQHFSDWIKDKNVNVFNATRGGMLEVYPRVDITEILK